MCLFVVKSSLEMSKISKATLLLRVAHFVRKGSMQLFPATSEVYTNKLVVKRGRNKKNESL
jgi:hypothetical protein